MYLVTAIAAIQSLSAAKLLTLFLTIVFATAVGVTAFILLTVRDVAKLRDIFALPQVEPELPTITSDGIVLHNKEDLENQLETLETTLSSTLKDLEDSKEKVLKAQDSIQQLDDTSKQVKKYYAKLKSDVAKSELSCKGLQQKIEEYRRRRDTLETRIKRNEEFYKDLLADMAQQCANSTNTRTLVPIGVQRGNSGVFGMSKVFTH